MHVTISYDTAVCADEFKVILEFPSGSEYDKQVETEVRSILISAVKEQLWRRNG